MAFVQISDVVVPEIFAPYLQQLTEEKSRIIQSGVAVRDSEMDGLLAGGGITFNTPSWKDLDSDDGTGADNVSTDTSGTSTPYKTGTSQEISVRLSRNGSWSTMDLSQALAGSDPMASIASRVSAWWVRRSQRMFISTITGVFADNAAAPTGADQHTQDDMTVDISGGAYSAGVTDFSAEAFIDACTTLGDSAEDARVVFVHSVVYSRMQKNNLIDFIPDSQGVINIPTFLGREVIVDDGMPASGGVYESWIFGAGTCRLGMGSPRVPVEVDRTPAAGNGGGQETLYSRLEWMLHPVGHAMIADVSSTPGGPSNSVLAAAATWRRVFPERKMIKIARLITRES